MAKRANTKKASPELKYPKEAQVDWKDFGDRVKALLLQEGEYGGVGHYFLKYEDEFMRITYARNQWGRDKGFLEVTRKEMPDHPSTSLHRTTNPLYMESGYDRIRVHGEGRYIYQHIIDKTTPEKRDDG